jgi:two-component system, chemotaxis family, sensor kinase CheA
MSAQVNLEIVRASFNEDAEEHMAAMEQALLTLERDPQHEEAIHQAFRAVHTIKGSCGIFQYDELMRFAHSLENLLDAARDGQLAITGEITALLLQAYDHLQGLLNHYARGNDESELSHLGRTSNTLILRMNQLMAAPAAVAEFPVRFHMRCKPDLFRSGMNLEGGFRFLLKQATVESIRLLTESLPEIAKLEPDSAYLAFEILFAPPTTPETARAELEDAFEFLLPQLELEPIILKETPADSPSGIGNPKPNVRPHKSIRVDSDKLDDFVNLVGELVMKNGSLHQLAQQQQVREFLRPVAELSRLVENIRELAMTLRMMAIDGTFRKMERLVRDIALQSAKEVNIRFEGGETELDKNIVEKISDPLVHIIRNAVDHGIESPDERRAIGKAPAGQITLAAFHEAGMVVIEITDDGRGLNYDRIREKAIEKGLAETDRVYSDFEIQQFIFSPGFSTAGAVSELSGRGVGMDVVKKNIDALRGNIRIVSESGRGMTLRIALPLTLAIIDGFLVRTGEQKFVIPLDTIKECIDFRPTAAVQSEYDNQLFNLRGEVLPYLRLSDVFNLTATAGGRQSLIVLQQGGHRFGVVIDEPLGEYQTVIKPLTGILAGIPGVGGATILGAREIALILDIQSLLNLVHTKGKKNKDKDIKGIL